jgi:hypothetical protein
MGTVSQATIADESIGSIRSMRLGGSNLDRHRHVCAFCIPPDQFLRERREARGA